MKHIISSVIVTTLALAVVACGNRHSGHEGQDGAAVDSLAADSLAADSAAFFAVEDDGLTMHEMPIEVFGDFIFAFTHNARFQAERIRFPLPVTELDGTERVIKSGQEFRNEFHLPGNDFYTIMLGERSQMDMLESDTILENITMQMVELEEQRMQCYHFQREDGRWFLTSRSHTPIPAPLADFMQFYEHFVADSTFQQESLAETLRVTIGDDEEVEEEEVVGTIEAGQWPAFRPEMPQHRFVNIDFGQGYPHPDHMLMLQCGISNSLMNTFTFRRDGDKWKLTSYEN